LDVRVETHRDGCLNAATNDDEVVDERISRTAPAVDLLAELLLLRGRHGLNNQNLEVWTAGVIVRYPKDHVVVIGSMLRVGDVVEGTRTV
jgi:hypothetical protein